jgi:hypothetical protein
MTAYRKLSRYRLDLMGVQEVRWECSGTAPAGENTFFYGKGYESHEFISDRMSYIMLRGCRFCIIVLNVHAQTEDKIDDVFRPTLESKQTSYPRGTWDCFLEGKVAGV